MEERCNISSDRKGLFISVINMKFDVKGYPDLKNSAFNKNFKPFIDKFGFTPLPKNDKENDKDYEHLHKNVSYSGFEQIINKVQREMSQNKYSCLAVSINTHGDMVKENGRSCHKLLCSKHKPDDSEMENRWISTNYLVRQFRKCFDGPMIILIQACRGAKEDHSVTVYQHNTPEQSTPGIDSGIASMDLRESTDSEQNEDNPENSTVMGPTQGSLTDSSANTTSSSQAEVQSTSYDDFVPMCPPNSVVAFSSAEGYISKSSNISGGWLLDSFEKAVNKFVNERRELNILSILTQANSVTDEGMASKKDNGKMCIGSFQHKLVEELVFNTIEERGDENDVQGDENDIQGDENEAVDDFD